MVNKYYEKHNEKFQKEARERYQNLSEKEKEKRQKIFRDKYENLSVEEKEKKLSIIVNVIRIFLKK